ncbi:MAG: hypothetical protein Q8Q49_03150, partial [bacterium]|nr:hypothetical protein [bacterium]
LQNIWNIWWVNLSVTKLHALPWFTNYIFYPSGVSLLGHTLNPFNGFMAIPLLKFFTLVQAYNLLVLFGFIATGIFTFYYALYISKSYIGSLLSGAIFTFSSFHFSHAEGHMQLVSVEWLPLFIYSWHLFLNKLSLKYAFFSGITLFAVLLCDLYYFFYAVVIGFIYLVWFLRSKNHPIRKKITLFLRNFGFFILIVLCTSGLIIVPFIMIASREGFQGAHESITFSLDLFSLFIPGGHWRFASITEAFWKKLPGNIQESSVSLPISVLFIVGYVWYKIRKIPEKKSPIKLFFFIFVLFLILAFGPMLQVNGHDTGLLAPYLIFDLLPVLNLSGVPVRMMVVVHLFAALIFAQGFALLMTRVTPKRIAFAIFLSLLLFIELFPRQIPLSRVEVPKYVYFLKNLPEKYSVIDTYSSPFSQLYFQTIHNKRMPYGYIARYPTSTGLNFMELNNLLKEEKYSLASKLFSVGYIVTKSSVKLPIRAIYRDKQVTIFTLR